jgi:plasmid stabilization system protein ParE
MRIRWTLPAVADLENIKDYLQRHYPNFAEQTVRTIYQHAQSLKTMPNRGRPGPPQRYEGTRACSVSLRRGVFRECRCLSKFCTSITVRRTGDESCGWYSNFTIERWMSLVGER